MSVDDWARREAERQWPEEEHEGRTRSVFADGLVHAFSALLSDEALHAMAVEVFAPHFPNNADVRLMRAALQAAVDAVTKEARSE